MSELHWIEQWTLCMWILYAYFALDDLWQTRKRAIAAEKRLDDLNDIVSNIK